MFRRSASSIRTATFCAACAHPAARRASIPGLVTIPSCSRFDLAERTVGIIGCAVGAPFAVLIAEELFACGCRLLLSMTSAGQIKAAGPTPYFVLIDRALRDEGTSYHYAAPAEFAEADPHLVAKAATALKQSGVRTLVGASWTTDAPFRETAQAIEAARAKGRARGRDGGGGALYLRARPRQGRALPRPRHQHHGAGGRRFRKGRVGRNDRRAEGSGGDRQRTGVNFGRAAVPR